MMTDEQAAIVQQAEAKFTAMINRKLTGRARLLLDRYGPAECEKIAQNDKECRELVLQLELYRICCRVCEEKGRVPLLNSDGELMWRKAAS
jgi:hypothetical protein